MSQPYVSWKAEATNSAIPNWSRPLPTDYPNSNGIAFKARPIKHWRKQLIPRDHSGNGKSGVGITMDLPGGSVYLGRNSKNCATCSLKDTIGIKEDINLQVIEPSNPTYKFLNPNTDFKSISCVACNPENNVIKSASTIINKNYYTDSRAYLKSRCKLYSQNLAGTQASGVNYFNSNGELLLPNDNANGPQVRDTLECSARCQSTSVVRTIYKPNNAQYATQGAVSSSSRLLRLQLNTINKNGSSFTNAFGAESANAGKYNGTSDGPYFLKNKYYKCVKTKCK